MKLDRKDAEQMAREYIDSMASAEGGGFYEIIRTRIREDEEGWYFPYQSKDFLSTGDFSKSLVGNWPIFVSRDGENVGPRRPGMPFKKS